MVSESFKIKLGIIPMDSDTVAKMAKWFLKCFLWETYYYAVREKKL